MLLIQEKSPSILHDKVTYTLLLKLAEILG